MFNPAILKVVVYKLTVRFVAGTPEFNLEKPVPISDKIGTWSSLGIAIVIVLVTHLIIGVKGLRKSQVKETKFKTHLLHTLEIYIWPTSWVYPISYTDKKNNPCIKDKEEGNTYYLKKEKKWLKLPCSYRSNSMLFKHWVGATWL